jgi:hypothetical protein
VVEGGEAGNRIRLCGGCPVGARGRCPSRFPMALSPFSIGIELRPEGVDRRWVRVWLLDRSAQCSARCWLVVRSAVLRRARELQAASGSAVVWWV